MNKQTLPAVQQSEPANWVYSLIHFMSIAFDALNH